MPKGALIIAMLTNTPVPLTNLEQFYIYFVRDVKLHVGLFPALSATSHAPLPNCCRHTQEYDGANVCFFVMMFFYLLALPFRQILSKYMWLPCHADKINFQLKG